MINRCEVNKSGEVRENYIIKSFTAGLLPLIDNYGYLMTQVVEENDYFAVRKSPLQIMQDSLLYYGHDLEGASQASRQALGNINMPPVKVYDRIYWFPIYSKEREHNIWLSANHVDRYKAENKKETSLDIGKKYTITLELSLRAYERKLNKARTLEKIHHDRFQEIDEDTPIETNTHIIKEYQHPYYYFAEVGQKPNNEKKGKQKIFFLQN
ncbi:competence protein ComK [Bacillus sp. SD088]|uniref:competence protein ComK n=1 Tax=Bacillus sp. SD088 TaxID=2782012 RepID=UPI001A962E56|nr:competence protein ComK [Bacillus sp. SD088]MBO0993113.1 competence protein ComK [Bacillus sp. SD088]